MPGRREAEVTSMVWQGVEERSRSDDMNFRSTPWILKPAAFLQLLSLLGETRVWEQAFEMTFNSLLVADGPVAAAKEHQWFALAGLGFLDLADVDGVIAAVIRGRDLALEP